MASSSRPRRWRRRPRKCVYSVVAAAMSSTTSHYLLAYRAMLCHASATREYHTWTGNITGSILQISASRWNYFLSVRLLDKWSVLWTLTSLSQTAASALTSRLFACKNLQMPFLMARCRDTCSSTVTGEVNPSAVFCSCIMCSVLECNQVHSLKSYI